MEFLQVISLKMYFVWHYVPILSHLEFNQTKGPKASSSPATQHHPEENASGHDNQCAESCSK